MRMLDSQELKVIAGGNDEDSKEEQVKNPALEFCNNNGLADGVTVRMTITNSANTGLAGQVVGSASAERTTTITTTCGELREAAENQNS